MVWDTLNNKVSLLNTKPVCLLNTKPVYSCIYLHVFQSTRFKLCYVLFQSTRFKLRYDGMIHHLEIPRVREYDGGQIRVVAKNPFGEGWGKHFVVSRTEGGLAITAQTGTKRRVGNRVRNADAKLNWDLWSCRRHLRSQELPTTS